MARPSSDELNAVGRLGDPSAHPRYSELALARAIDEYLPRRREPVATYALRVDGRTVPHLYAALVDRSLPFATIELERTGEAPEPGRWEFLRPFAGLTVRSEGGSEVRPATGAPVRVMARLLLREHYVPMTKPGSPGGAPPGRTSPRPELFTPASLAAYLRSTGIVPFTLAIAVYYPEERVRYEYDLLDGQVMIDPRSHRLAPERRVTRTARLGHAVDVIVGSGELSLPSVRALEAVVESAGLSAVEMAPLYGGVRELGASALDSLVARKLLAHEPRSGVYQPRLEAIAAAGAKLPAAAKRSGTNPRLRSNLDELLAQAESKATCPLCGDPLPAPRRGILCAKCQTLVGSGTAARA